MKLQAKLTSAFGVVALVTLAISLLGLWQVQRLGSALYEVGAVRLPSIHGLSQMTNAMLELQASARLLATELPRERLPAERTQQEWAWQDFAAGWAIYEPLPQTPDEAMKWRAFVPIARAWQADYRAQLAAVMTAIETTDAPGLASARDQLAATTENSLARTLTLLGELTDLNYRVADEAKRASIASHRDMEQVRDVMIVSALVSVFSAIVFGVMSGRWLTRPIVALANAFAKVAAGDRRVKVDAGSHDEVAQMGHALNAMVEALRVNESRLQLLADSLPDIMLYQVARSPDGRMNFLHVSAGVERLHGVSAEAVLQDASLLYSQIVDCERARVAAAESASLARMTVFNVETRILRPDGTARWVQMLSQPRREPDGRVVWDGVEFDITDRRRSADEVQRANRALRALSQTNHALVHATDEMTFLEQVCRIVVETGGYRLAWVGFAEHDAEKTVRRVAYAGETEVWTYLTKVRILWSDTPLGRGPTGIAIRTGQPASSKNIAQDPRLSPWREEAERTGLVSSMVFPLRVDGTVIGAVSIYAADADAFDDQEAALLGELAEDMAFGIQALRARAHRERAEADVRRLLADAEQARLTLLSILEDRQQAEEARQRSDQLYRDAMQNSAIGMAIVGLDGRWLEVNAALCRIVGYSREEMLALTFHAVTHPADREDSRQQLRRLLDGEIAALELEKCYLHKSGRVVWVLINSSLVRDGAGRPPHLVTQTQDITSRRQAEASLEEAAERLALALRVSKFGVWRHNLQTRVSEWDARMFAIFGLPPSTQIPTVDQILNFVVEEDRAGVRRSWTALPTCNHSYHLRFRVTRPDGKIRHLELQGTVRDDHLGRAEWSIGVAGDITEIIEATTESERLRAQLIQSQKMETLGTLAAGVAHDFNNLLTGINGFVELASASVGPGHEAVDLLKQARRGAMSARDLVRRILSFSRASKDNRRVQLNVIEVVRDTAPLVAAAMPANVSLSVAVECAAAPVLADSGQLQQVLMNLCTNGAHAIGGKAGTIQIGVDCCELVTGRDPAIPAGCVAGRYVRISIRDDGSGMSEETRKRIFEPFFTTKQAGEGTGLGLTIVHDIVRAHEGGLEVTSVLGAGTTFALYLPRIQSEAELPPTTQIAALVRGAGQKIMIVDDEPSVAMVVRLTLKKSGYEPVMFTSSTDAWKNYEAAPGAVELLIVDQNMPEISGPELVGRVRRLSPVVPVIMMSGRFERSSELAALRIEQIKKPFEISDLLATVKAALRGGDGRPTQS